MPEDEDVVAACGRLRQGDVLDLAELPVVDIDGIKPRPTPLGVAIVSQTCDLVQANRPNVTVAKIVKLAGTACKEAASGAQPRYVLLPACKSGTFVDLEFCASVSKSQAVRLQVVERGVDSADDVQIRQLALALGRRFSRFPFPDEVYPWLRPLQTLARDKHAKPDSALGRALREVVELRVEATNWQESPLEISLHVIIKSGTVPEPDSIDSDPPQALATWLCPPDRRSRKPAEIAEKLFPADVSQRPSSLEAYYLWGALAEALAAACRPQGRDAAQQSVMSAVSSIVGQLSSEDEFTLSQYRRSELLDLDHLSHPTPFAS